MSDIQKTIEELRFFKAKLFNGIFSDRIGCFDDAIRLLEELQQYRSIGTVEEYREAREKQKAKKPEKKPDKYSDLTQHYYCPSCGRYFGQRGIHDVILFNKEKYCQGDNCGQAIDWSEV